MKKKCVMIAFLSLVAIIGLSGCEADGSKTDNETPWPLAVRFRSYGDYAEAAWTHLPVQQSPQWSARNQRQG